MYSANLTFPYTLAALVWADWVVLFLFASVVVGIGIWCSRRQTNLGEYFTASGSMGSLVVGISLYATLLSTISYLATPGEIIVHGPAILAMLLALPIVYVLVGYWLIPSIMRYRVTSAYEILEIRLGRPARLTGALMFICLRLSWMGMILFLSAKALVILLGWDEDLIPVLVVVIGVVSIAYTAIGGLRAVILTDMLQFVTLFGGALLTIGLITWWLGGFEAWWPTRWMDSWDRPPLFSLDPRERLSVIGLIILGVQWWICTAGSDQTAIQRYMAVRDTAAARRSFLINVLAYVGVTCTLAAVGFALLGLFQARPELLPAGWTVEANADGLFPHFIGHQLPAGISGLVLAGLFAAGMSSIDSGVNAVTAVVMVDLIAKDDKKPQADNPSTMTHAVLLVSLIGVLAIGAGLLAEHVPGNFLEASQKTINLLVAPLFGLFFMALFVPWANLFGTLIGAAYGLGTSILVAFWDVLTGHPGLGFQWIGVYALIVQISTGCFVSWIPFSSSAGRLVAVPLALAPLLAAYCYVLFIA